MLFCEHNECIQLFLPCTSSQSIEATSPASPKVALQTLKDVLRQHVTTLFAALSSISLRPTPMIAVVVLHDVLSDRIDGVLVGSCVGSNHAISGDDSLRTCEKTILIPL
jgi:hypothetical protein